MKAEGAVMERGIDSPGLARLGGGIATSFDAPYGGPLQQCSLGTRIQAGCATASDSSMSREEVFRDSTPLVGCVKEQMRLDVERMSSLQLSLDHIAEMMTGFLGEPVSVHRLKNWLAESKDDRRLPAAFLPAWFLVTGSTGVLNVILAPVDLVVIEKHKLPLIDLGMRMLELRGFMREIEGREEKRS